MPRVRWNEGDIKRTGGKWETREGRKMRYMVSDKAGLSVDSRQ